MDYKNPYFNFGYQENCFHHWLRRLAPFGPGWR